MTIWDYGVSDLCEPFGEAVEVAFSLILMDLIRKELLNGIGFADKRLDEEEYAHIYTQVAGIM